MSMEHKAFDFDWDEFEIALLPVFLSTLASNDSTGLLEFIELNLENITDPYEGDKLGKNWQVEISSYSIQEIADYALTKYYSVTEEFGLGNSWISQTDKLSKKEVDALLGTSFKCFDPGCYGSYFQSLGQLNESIKILSNIKDPIVAQYVRDLSGMKKGLYVTF